MKKHRKKRADDINSPWYIPPPYFGNYAWWVEAIWRLFIGWKFTLDHFKRLLLGPSKLKLRQIEGRVVKVHVQRFTASAPNHSLWYFLQILAHSYLSSTANRHMPIANPINTALLGGSIELEDGQVFWWMKFDATTSAVSDKTDFFISLEGQPLRAAVYEHQGVLSALALRVEGLREPTIIYAFGTPTPVATCRQEALSQREEIFSDIAGLIVLCLIGMPLSMLLGLLIFGPGTKGPEEFKIAVWSGPLLLLLPVLFALLLQTIIWLFGLMICLFQRPIRPVPEMLKRSRMTNYYDIRASSYDMGRLAPYLRQLMDEPEGLPRIIWPVEKPNRKMTLYIPLGFAALYIATLIASVV